MCLRQDIVLRGLGPSKAGHQPYFLAALAGVAFCYGSRRCSRYSLGYTLRFVAVGMERLVVKVRCKTRRALSVDLPADWAEKVRYVLDQLRALGHSGRGRGHL